jgi:dienelactone hydrolase
VRLNAATVSEKLGGCLALIPDLYRGKVGLDREEASHLVCVCLPACLSACLSVCLSIYLSLCLSVSLSLCLSVSLSLCVSVSLHISLPLRVCVSFSVCVSVCVRLTHTHMFSPFCLPLRLSVHVLAIRRSHAQMSNLDWSNAVTDVEGAAHALKTEYGVEKVGVVGFCMGGALTLAALVKAPSVDAGVSFYGIPPLQLADVATITKPVQCHFGDRDTVSPPPCCLHSATHRMRTQHKGFSDPEAAKALEDKFKANNVPYELFMCTFPAPKLWRREHRIHDAACTDEGVGHGFVNDPTEWYTKFRRDVGVRTPSAGELSECHSQFCCATAARVQSRGGGNGVVSRPCILHPAPLRLSWPFVRRESLFINRAHHEPLQLHHRGPRRCTPQ